MTRPVADRPSAREHAPVTGRIYSVGYEGFKLDGFVDTLIAAEVTTVIDVRLTPLSRKQGFSSKTLSASLQAVGIEYVHESELGNPPDNRDAFRTGDGSAGRRRMEAILRNGSGQALQRVVEQACATRIALLCVERDGNRCHRKVITDMIQEIEPSIEVWPIL